MEIRTFETGHIRPPFHANSLLLRITENCTWNKCNFCTLYKGGRFKTRSVDVIKKEIDNVAYYRDMILKHRIGDGEFDMDRVTWEYSGIGNAQEKDCYAMVFNWIRTDGMQSVFLQDANTLVLKPSVLADIIAYLKKALPSLTLVAAYGRADTLINISPEEFLLLREAGLTMIHSGYESGCDEVLKLLNKGTNSQQQVIAGQRIKKAGFNFNVFYMPGSGGKSLSHKNAIETAEVINAVNPDFVRIRTFVVKEGSPMWEMQKNGEFQECGDIEKVMELREMLSAVKNCNGYVISDHIINLLPEIEGWMDKDMKGILAHIDRFMNLPEKERRRFQLARRMLLAGSLASMNRIGANDMNTVNRIEKQVTNDVQWEELMRKHLRQYI
ncbi:MAG: radical SAM protein [Anaerotignaceae bacterium]